MVDGQSSKLLLKNIKMFFRNNIPQNKYIMRLDLKNNKTYNVYSLSNASIYHTTMFYVLDDFISNY